MEANSPVRIVVVEDNPGDVQLLRYALNSRGDSYTLEVISDGAEALEFLNHLAAGWGEQDPCALILDLQLPKRNGMEVLRAVRTTPALSKLKIVVFSTSLSPRERAEIAQLDVQSIVEKPRDIEGFMRFAEQVLEMCRERATLASA